MNQSMNQRDMFFKWLYYAGAVLLTFRQGVELSAALSLTGRELAVTVVLSPLVYLLLRSVHNRILR